MAHTPGPWTVKPHDGSRLVLTDRLEVRSEERNQFIVAMMDGEQDAANARLIAKAPEMLELCRAALAYLDDDSHSPRRRTANQHALRALLAEIE